MLIGDRVKIFLLTAFTAVYMLVVDSTPVRVIVLGVMTGVICNEVLAARSRAIGKRQRRASRRNVYEWTDLIKPCTTMADCGCIVCLWARGGGRR